MAPDPAYPMQPFCCSIHHRYCHLLIDIRRLRNERGGSAGRFVAWLAVMQIMWLPVGCTSSPLQKKKAAAPVAVSTDPSGLQLVGDLTRVWGMQAQPVDGVALIVGLPNTGSDPPPTGPREMLLAEMQRQEVDKPNSILASPTTALVNIRGVIPPGAKKGDRFDIEIVAPKDSGTTNLAGGWLMEARLREYAAVNGRVAEGHILALAQGDLLTEAALDEAVDDVSRIRGVVLGGGVALKARGFGLIVKDEFASVKTSSRIGEAINARFNVYRRGQRKGVANPQRDNYVELIVHPRYEDNIVRYVRVIQNIAVRENAKQRSTRLDEFRRQLARPSTAALAAIRLEAIGDDGVPALKDAINSSDREIQFYAAEALAYLDEPDAVPILGDAIRNEPAFRSRALGALAAMECISAHDELIDLMNDSSAETRYGAFRILRQRTPFDPILGGNLIADKFYVHEVNSTGPSLIHVSRQDRAELVFFGSDHYFAEPLVLFVGRDLVVRSAEPGMVTVSRMTSANEDEKQKVSTKVSDAVKALVQFGASYADVVQGLSEAKRTGSLSSRLEFSAIATTGRTYSRDQEHDPLNASDGADNSAAAASGLDTDSLDSSTYEDGVGEFGTLNMPTDDDSDHSEIENVLDLDGSQLDAADSDLPNARRNSLLDAAPLSGAAQPTSTSLPSNRFDETTPYDLLEAELASQATQLPPRLNSTAPATPSEVPLPASPYPLHDSQSAQANSIAASVPQAQSAAIRAPFAAIPTTVGLPQTTLVSAAQLQSQQLVSNGQANYVNASGVPTYYYPQYAQTQNQMQLQAQAQARYPIQVQVSPQQLGTQYPPQQDIGAQYSAVTYGRPLSVQPNGVMVQPTVAYTTNLPAGNSWGYTMPNDQPLVGNASAMPPAGGNVAFVGNPSSAVGNQSSQPSKRQGPATTAAAAKKAKLAHSASAKAHSKSPIPPVPEGVLPGVDLLDLIDPAAGSRRF